MASWYHTVSPQRIADPRLRGSSPLARLIWVHLLCSELATHVPGLARGGPGTLAEHLGQDLAEVGDALGELAGRGMIEIDLEARLIRLPGVARDHRKTAGSANVVTHWITCLSDLPASTLITAHARELADLDRRSEARWNAVAAASEANLQALLEPSGKGSPGALAAIPLPPRVALDKGLPQPSGDQDQDLDQDQEQPPNPQGGEGPDSCLLEAWEVLNEGRASLGLAAAPRPDARVQRSLRRAVKTEPDLAAELPRLVRRAVEARRREWAEGKDHRQYLTLSDVLKHRDRWVHAAHLDLPDHGPRAPPGVDLKFFEAPTGGDADSNDIF